MNKFRLSIQKAKYIINLVVLVVGMVLIVVAFVIKPDNVEADKNKEVAANLALSIGSSLTATSLMTLFLIVLLPDDTHGEENELQEWGINHIYRERGEVKLSGTQLPKEHLDYIAFGLKHFREANKPAEIEQQLKRGLIIRIITLNPNSQFVTEQQRMENRDGLKAEIEGLQELQKNLLEAVGSRCKGRIEIKYYNSLPLSFYCRADQRVFVGPYLPGMASENVITYEFKAGAAGGNYYANIFETLWTGKGFKLLDTDDFFMVGDQKASIESALKFFCKSMVDSRKDQEPIGVTVIFKGEQRRTIFSCNKQMGERHNCYPKNSGTVGHLITLNENLNSGHKILFEDFKNELAFTSNHTDSGVRYQRVEFQKGVSPRGDDETIAIMAIPIITTDKMIGAITFDFCSLPERYMSVVENLKRINTKTTPTSTTEQVLQDWFMLAESCRQIIQPMLGSAIELQYRTLFEEKW